LDKKEVNGMKELKKSFLTAWLVALFCAVFVFAGIANALVIVLEPESVARKVGDKVRVCIYADGAQALISMGIKISFNPESLQVTEASKYEDVENGWLMDDGNASTTGDPYNDPPVEIDNTAGTVTMIGGHLNGPSPTGLSGKVPLGWIVFEATKNGNSNIHVDLGKYHPEDPTQTFDNFVRMDETIDEPTNVPGDLGIICIVNNACLADISGNGVVDMHDWLEFGKGWGRTDCNAPGAEPCGCDLNVDGVCDMQDWLVFGEDWGRTNCPVCP
jgi:hypothetical protein